MLKEFQRQAVTFVESMPIKEGVVCDVYRFTDDPSKDLGIVTISPGTSTSKFKILQGEKTLEGFFGGSGQFIKNDEIFDFSAPIEFVVHVGDTVQWRAGDTGLQFYEICYPPFKEGRFETLVEPVPV